MAEESSTPKTEGVKVSDYGIFNSGIETVNLFKGQIDDVLKIATDVDSGLGDDVFKGPIMDSIRLGLGEYSKKLGLSSSNFGNVGEFLKNGSDSLQGTDAKNKKLFLNLGADGVVKTEEKASYSGGNTQASSLYELGDKANNGDKNAQKEELDRLAEIVKPICDEYGFPTSVLLAQIIQESGWVHSGKWLVDANNVLSVNSEMWGRNDYKVAKDGTVNEDAPIPKWASNPKHVSGMVSGGAYFEAPREDSMRAYDSVEDCVEDYLGLMVGYRPDLNGADVDSAIEGIRHYAEDVNYASSLHRLIKNNNLTQYDK